MGPLLLLVGTALAGPHTILVGVEDAAAGKAVQALADAGGGRTRCWRAGPICIVDFDAAPDLAAWRAVPGVRYVEADRLMDIGPLGDETGTEACPDLWDLSQIRVVEAWDHIGSRGAGFPVVAIQDTGFLSTHVDLVGQVSGRFDYGDVDTTPEVEWSVGVPAHGTFIGGIVAGRDDNGEGRAGVVPAGRMNLQKIADSGGNLYFSYAVAAMLDLADGDLGVGALNYSIASSSTTTAFDEAIEALGDMDILLVAAAGNCSSADCWNANNDDYALFPANSPGGHVLSVAGSTQDDALNPYSHYGASSVDLAAPGVSICSLGVNSDTDTYTSAGTSYAAPLVAGVASLVRGASPDLTAVETARILRASSVETAGLDGKVRSGRLDAFNAVRAPMPRLDDPDDLNSSPREQMTLRFENAAAAATGILVVQHGEGLQLGGAWGIEDWGKETHQAGETVTLPDAGPVTLTRRTSILSGPLDARSDLSFNLSWIGREVGDHPVTVRLIATAPGTDYLNAPYLDGIPDDSGFNAHSFVVTVDEADPVEDTAAPSDSGPEHDTGPAPDDTARDEDTHAPIGDDIAEDPAGGCGCATGSAPASVALILPLLFVAGRRRVPR